MRRTNSYTTTKLNPVFKNAFIEVYPDHENNWVYANWTGTPNLEDVKAGLEAVLTAMIESGLYKILNDNRFMTGSWTDALEWIMSDWSPRAIRQGYHAVAFIYSPDVFARFSVDALLMQTDSAGPVKSKPFNNVEPAAAWLAMQ